jgi:hypothetical protein
LPRSPSTRPAAAAIDQPLCTLRLVGNLNGDDVLDASDTPFISLSAAPPFSHSLVVDFGEGRVLSLANITSLSPTSPR